MRVPAAITLAVLVVRFPADEADPGMAVERQLGVNFPLFALIQKTFALGPKAVIISAPEQPISFYEALSFAR